MRYLRHGPLAGWILTAAPLLLILGLAGGTGLLSKPHARPAAQAVVIGQEARATTQSLRALTATLAAQRNSLAAAQDTAARMQAVAEEGLKSDAADNPAVSAALHGVAGACARLAHAPKGSAGQMVAQVLAAVDALSTTVLSPGAPAPATADFNLIHLTPAPLPARTLPAVTPTPAATASTSHS